MKDVPLARRRCLQVSALAGCSMLLGCRVLAAEEPLSADHIRSIRLPFFDLESCRFDQGRLVRLKRFESRSDMRVIGGGVIKDRITVLAAS